MLALGHMGANANDFSIWERIKDIDPIMTKFESVLSCNSSDAAKTFLYHLWCTFGVLL